jgi:type II secretory pathway pseudopilin PulG
LLVVVAIIAVLAALLLPALRGARDRAHQVVCFNNLAQIGVAIQLYTLDNNGWYPPSWDHRAGNPNYRWSHPRFVGNNLGRSRGVLRCPSDERPSLVNPTEFDYQFSYGQIVYGGGLQIGTLSGSTYYDGYAPRQSGGVVTVHQVDSATGQPTGGGVFSWDPIASPTTVVHKQYTPYMFEAEDVATHLFSLTRVRHGGRKTVMNYLGFDLRPHRIDLTGSNWGFHLQAGPEDPIPTWHTVDWYRADMGNYYSAPNANWPFKE